MNKFFFIVLLFIMFQAPFAHAEQIYYFSDSISGKEFNHVSFTILRDIDIEIWGISDGNVSFLAFDAVNYQNWLDLINYTSIHQTPISGEFTFRILTSLPVNSTLNLLFYNSGSNAVQIEITIDEIVNTTDESPILILPIIISLPLVLFVYRKSIRSS
ncbi:MAG: hypothetical protein GPJ54_14890 [Candidatus Heimdallarchaeota archaeon]|nr:hypothetical protein [Candidatus Heimdallarchaeota archaeon]